MQKINKDIKAINKAFQSYLPAYRRSMEALAIATDKAAQAFKRVYISEFKPDHKQYKRAQAKKWANTYDHKIK